MMDLTYKYKSSNNSWITENSTPISANIISLSGCRDDQTSADAWLRGQWCGALTTCFIDALVATNFKGNIFDLLEETRKLLREKNFSQIPQLTSDRKINPDRLFPMC